MAVDTEALKIVEGRLNGKTFFRGVGRAKSTKKNVLAEASFSKMGGSGEYKTEREYEWDYFLNPANMPGFIPSDQLRLMVSGTVSAVSSTAAVPSVVKEIEKTVRVAEGEGRSYSLSPERGLEKPVRYLW